MMQETGNSSDWDKCSAIDCPMPSTVKPEGKSLCTYHAGEELDYHADITKAVKKYAKVHNKLCEMYFWTAKQWAIKYPYMANWQFCPMEPGENLTPNSYIERLRKKLVEAIKNEASTH